MKLLLILFILKLYVQVDIFKYIQEIKNGLIKNYNNVSE